MPFSLILFFLSITAIFLNNVFVDYNVFQLNFFLILSIPIFFFLPAGIKNKKIHLPVKETIFYLIFMIFSTVSTFSAVNKETAVKYLLTYAAGYFFFIFSFNHQKNLNKYLKWFLIIISIFSSLIFLADKSLSLKIFTEGGSIFYTGYYHNELGNLLILGIIICLYEFVFENNNRLLILLLFFLPFLIFSYSRSAYLAIIVIGIIFFFIKKNWLSMTLIILAISLFFVTAKEVNKFFPVTVNKFMVDKLSLPKEKSFTGKRQQHIYYSLLSIRDRPFFGYGPDNLYYSTLKRQFNWQEGTTTAHNIILDIFSENGILAGIGFLLFLAFIFKESKKNLYFYLFSALTIIFLFDFSYKFLSVFLIWMIMAGISVRNDENTGKVSGNIILFPIALLFIFGQIIFLAKIFYKTGLTNLSLRTYPLNSEVHQAKIEDNIKKGKTEEGLKNLMEYDFLYKEGPDVNIIKGKYSEELNDKKKAIYFYGKAIYAKPLLIPALLSKINALNIDVYGKNIGRLETTKFIGEFKSKAEVPKKSDVEKIIREFCYDYKLKCQ